MNATASPDGRRADVIIIGLGSAGEALAGSLADAGLDVVGFEPSLIGGECPYLACMPSKSMLHDAHDTARSPDRSLESRWSDAVRHRDEVAEQRNDTAHAADLEDRGVTILRTRAMLVGVGSVEADGVRWDADHVIIATGSGAVIPPIDGLERDRVWTSDDAMSSDARPRRVFIVGGGAIGCELGDVYRSFGSTVVVAEQSDRLLAGFDRSVADRYAELLRNRGLDLRLGTVVTHVEHRGDETVVTTSDGSSVTADRVIVATGQRPRMTGIGFGAIGLTEQVPPLDARFRVVGHPWLRVIGDANGSNPWTHGANLEAAIVADDLVGRPWEQTDFAMPRAVFTDPPAAHVGESTDSMTEAGRAWIRGSARYRDVARWTTDGLDDGEVAVVVDATSGRVVGMSVVGAAADEMIAVGTSWVHLGAHIGQARRQVFAFPTISQVVEVAAADAARQWEARSASAMQDGGAGVEPVEVDPVEVEPDQL